MKKPTALFIILLYSGLFSSLHADHMNWWREARFGMFIHWGLYAIPAGEWNGEIKYAEWIRDRAEIPINVYNNLVSRFNPTAFNPDQWVKTAKQAGMKYIVLTSKHHDGFCLFNSEYTDFDIMSTPYKKDILRQLVKAAAREGMHIGWYYSIMDWHHPDYLPRRPWEEAARSAQGANFDRYIAYMKNQLREIITNYNDIEIIWFDGGWENTWTQTYGNDLVAYVKRLKPTIIVNNRASKNPAGISGLMEGTGYGGDFGTPEQEIPATGLPAVDWETCMTLNDHWGFKKNDTNWKSTETLLRYLADIASKGGNFLLNVGPTALGLIPEASVTRLDSVGKWMKTNGEAIYGTQAGPFQKLDWGRCTQKTIYGGTRLYLHVFDWPDNGSLIVPGIMNQPLSARLLSDAKQVLPVKRQEDAIVITVPAAGPDQINSVIVLDVDGKPDIVEPPVLTASAPIFLDHATVSVAKDSTSVIRYTVDGSEPTAAASPYKDPLRLTETTVVSARAFRDGKAVSHTARLTVTRVIPQPARTVEADKPGLRYAFYEGVWDRVPDFTQLSAVRSGTTARIDLSPALKDKYFGLTFSGYLNIPESAVYVISIASNDGSLLYIDNELLVNNDEDHPLKEKETHVALEEGLHAIRIAYFQEGGSADLKVYIKSAEMEKQEIPAAMYRMR